MAVFTISTSLRASHILREKVVLNVMAGSLTSVGYNLTKKVARTQQYPQKKQVCSGEIVQIWSFPYAN